MGGLKGFFHDVLNKVFGGDEGRKEAQRKARELLRERAAMELPRVKEFIEPISDGLSAAVRELIARGEEAAGVPIGELLALRIETLDNAYKDLLLELEIKTQLDLNQDGKIG